MTARSTNSIRPIPPEVRERTLTQSPYNKILTNVGVWSQDGQWIVYDVRPDVAGSIFDGERIERVHVETGEVEVLYESRNGAKCGVVTCSPIDDRVVFILGPERSTPDWTYGPSRRQGAIVSASRPSEASFLDARDLVAPFTPGALRGGSHVHVFSPDASRVSYTYDDEVLTRLDEAHAPTEGRDANQRNVAVSLLGRPVGVPRTHERNHEGQAFSVVVTRTINEPRPGSDEICRACEEGWIGDAGYVTPGGERRRWALAYQGTVVAKNGSRHAEVFVADLPEDLTFPGPDGPLEGTTLRRPAPPAGVVQRRLTFTDDEAFPGLAGPRHWLRSSPDGSKIAFLRRDRSGSVRLWTVPPWGDEATAVTDPSFSVESAFTWSPDGQSIAHVSDGSVCVTEVETGETTRLTEKATSPQFAPRSEACVFSPDGRRIASMRTCPKMRRRNQVHVVEALPTTGRVLK
ncbi:MAG TPA: DUF3748 domain-containing protein [Pirellulaceae bacterium]|jgi:hypothetical protein|nr:DUF3748 domain-containing protein [Pirellulaceae bacterium]